MTTPRRAFHRRPSLLEQTRVADVMTADLITCPPETPLRQVARLMSLHRVHSVIVFDYRQEDDEAPELWGIVSDLDLVEAAWADLGERTAGGSASSPLVTVRSDDGLDHAAQLMVEHGVSHLAVVDRVSQRPVGVLSTLDVARVVAD
jgi:CBS domain-containing protein